MSSSLISVVLPLPLVPTMAVILPAGIWRLISLRTASVLAVSYRKVKLLIWIGCGLAAIGWLGIS
ncbi:hypothetical protein D3C73_1238220 [compost metagenome]